MRVQGARTQQPVWQKEPNGQVVPQGPPQSAAPAGHSWQLHSGGRTSFPTQSSHVSHGLRHAATWVHGWHFVGSPSESTVQLELPFASVEPSQTGFAAPGTKQQPKQSQPLGVSGPQIPLQVLDCAASACEHVRLVPEIFDFAS